MEELQPRVAEQDARQQRPQVLGHHRLRVGLQVRSEATTCKQWWGSGKPDEPTCRAQMGRPAAAAAPSIQITACSWGADTDPQHASVGGLWARMGRPAAAAATAAPNHCLQAGLHKHTCRRMSKERRASEAAHTLCALAHCSSAPAATRSSPCNPGEAGEQQQ